jgi:hypothetical protein
MAPCMGRRGPLPAAAYKALDAVPFRPAIVSGNAPLPVLQASDTFSPIAGLFARAATRQSVQLRRARTGAPGRPHAAAARHCLGLPDSADDGSVLAVGHSRTGDSVHGTNTSRAGSAARRGLSRILARQCSRRPPWPQLGLSTWRRLSPCRVLKHHRPQLRLRARARCVPSLATCRHLRQTHANLGFSNI